MSNKADHARLSRFLSGDCAECGTPGYRRHLSAVSGCATCIADNPYPVHIPVRNSLLGTVRTITAPPAYSAWNGRTYAPPSLPEECHRTPGGIMIHVKPGCRCPRQRR